MGCLSVILFHSYKGMCLLQRKEHIHRLKLYQDEKTNKQTTEKNNKGHITVLLL